VYVPFARRVPFALVLGDDREPIRVLRVIARLNVGGPSLHVSYLAEGLETRGYRTTLAAGRLSDGEGDMAFVAAGRGIDVEWIPHLQREISPARDIAVVRHLAGVIRRERPHVLHTHTAKAGAVGRLAALASGQARPPVIVHTFHGHMLKNEFDPVRERAFRNIERRLAAVADTLVTVSPEVRDELVEIGVAPATKFAIVRLGIELSERVGGEEEGAALRSGLGVSVNRFMVGWVGRMTAVKQVGDVLVTVRRLRDRGCDAALVMVGDGPDREVLEQRARALGLDEGVFFVGFQEDVGPWFHSFDALLLPSRSEGTPVSAIETLASGRPVVATRVGGVADVVHEGVDGYLVEFGDVQAAADRLARLAADPRLRRQMGAVGRERVLRRYRVPRLVEDVDRLYRALLAAKGLNVAAGVGPSTSNGE
jgi:glycosyltransferase involved in cell wall biosynthesis